ncbi:hypothetical protein CsSME_00047688 [Camellia sinensis var. sinensis]|uniref:AN1-type domain-containing protein n=1 Tax=Camellia sinensis var. sinensis TaxID=542762 RepID=A0A4S4EM06_CAMSN|nr:zinc finger A20 and AN1 domain-containing stress-associated protein 5-like [Camellia sinensis]THG17673.1 hypothetical protein TEA_014782 [Camellia sinensis var. sinensis]
MAQKREKEETELKVPETLIRTTPIPSPPKLSSSDDSTSSNSSRSDPPPDNNMIHKNDDDSRSCSVRSPERSTDLTSPPPPPHLRRARLQQPLVVAAAATEVKRREVNRCSGCKRKVGLTGFRCRCGDLFCSEHRYSDRHDCSFDYKAAGREAIARENPVVRAAKILKV